MQKSAEWVGAGACVVSYLFSQNLSIPLITRKDVGGGFLVLPLSASCGGLWCGGVGAVPLVTRAAASTGCSCRVRCLRFCSAGHSCGGHPLIARGAMGFVLFCWSLVWQASCCFIARVVCRCVKAACRVDGCASASCRAGLRNVLSSRIVRVACGVCARAVQWWVVRRTTQRGVALAVCQAYAVAGVLVAGGSCVTSAKRVRCALGFRVLSFIRRSRPIA